MSRLPILCDEVLSGSAGREAFRSRLRAWLSENIPRDWVSTMSGASPARYAKMQRDWFNVLAQVGLGTAHWPKEWGGVELPLGHQVVVYEEMARLNAPTLSMYSVSLYHLPATMFAHGSEAQRSKYLSGVKERGDVWCQGFSEPNAGSDLASLRTRAERKGDRYVVNGQKIWSSFSMQADYCLLLARTNPEAPKKQAGISFFVMDMRSPGIQRRPIRQATGDEEFGALFLDNVEIPLENLIGAENDGWRIAQSTLSAERGLLIFDMAERMAGAIARDISGAGALAWWHDQELRRECMRIYGAMQGVRELIREMLEQIEADPHTVNSQLPPIVKISFSELLQRYNGWRMACAGLTSLLEQPRILGGGFHTGDVTMDFLETFALTISGGTNEVLRNVIAERTLGLPREAPR
jgi:alkylation response protein AidB-like acyl-CoA dehydrogenase